MSTIRWSPLIAAAIVCCVASSSAVAGKKPYVEGERLEFRLRDLEGRVVASSDERFRDKVVLVGLWATWCPPCLTEIPTLIDLQERFGPRGLVVVAIAFESEDEEEATRRQRLRAFVDDNDINYLVLEGGTTTQFERALPQVKNIKGLPVEILIDRCGRVVEARHSYGFKKSWVRKLERDLDELLGSD